MGSRTCLGLKHSAFRIPHSALVFEPSQDAHRGIPRAALAPRAGGRAGEDPPPARAAEAHRPGAHHGVARPRRRVVLGLSAGRVRPVRRPGPRRRRDHGPRTHRRPPGRRGGERRYREGGVVVAGNDQEDPPRPGDRHAPAGADRLPGRLRRREPPVPGRRLSGTVRRGADLLLQLDHAALPARAANRRRDGPVHRRRRVPAGAVGCHLHGGGHVVHGAGRPEPRERRDGPARGRRTPGRGEDTHRGERCRPLSRPGRCRTPETHARARRPPAAPPAPPAPPPSALAPGRQAQRDPNQLYDLLPADHRMSYDVRAVLECVLDSGTLAEFQPEIAPEMICGHGAIAGRPVALIANSRGVIKGKQGEPPKIGGIIYTESAEKVAYFIDTADRERTPLLFVQDVSGFMVGTEAEHSGIIRAGARFVEAMATATVPKLVLTVNHASGAGYYAMAGQGFDPDFIVSWPTGRMGVMEGESAIQAVFGNDAAKPENAPAVDAMRADYEHQLDARFAAARGFVDAIV